LADLIVADASPLIVLARVGHLKTLARVAGKIIVPDIVAQECLHNPARPGAQHIGEAFALGLLSRQPKYPTAEPVNAPGLDEGESAAIGLAVALQAPILVDERIGRQVAQLHSLKVIGTLGILLIAKQRGYIELIAPVIASLKQESFFIAPILERDVLVLAGEN
jgi:uncharacterized protein